MTNGSSSGATLIYGNGYFDGSNNKRSSGTQNNCRLTIAGNTSTNMLAFEFDAGGTVDTNVSYVNYFNIDQNANVTLGTSTLNPTHIINGALSATNNSTSNQTVFYANTSGTSGIPTVLSRSTTGANTTFLGFNTGGSSAGSPGTGIGTIRINAANTAMEFTFTSDVSLKKNIKDYEGGLAKVKALKTRVFDWIDDTLPDNCVSFIAQEVKEVIPEAISEMKDKDGKDILGIGTQSFIPYIWAALRELTEKVEKIEGKKKTKKDEE
jgi:hypothetical protein